MLRRCLGLAGFALGFWLITSAPAYAYIDPGSTSFVVQFLVGAGVAAIAAIGIFWRRVFGFFQRVFARKAQ